MAAVDVTDEVWDHVLLGAPAPRECALPAGLLARMRREFLFWYPFDLRVRRQGLSGERVRCRAQAVVYSSMLCVGLGCALEHAVCAMYFGLDKVFTALVHTCVSCKCVVLCDSWPHCMA